MDVGLVILDGWGLNPNSDVRDAVATADTPNFDAYRSTGAFGTLQTHGHAVGLPEGQMGNSEVGHLNIGAGRVLTQESARITDAIRRSRGEPSTFDTTTDPPLFENEAILSAFEYARTNGGRVHFLGLVSDGGVHSYQSHLHALIDIAADQDVEAVTHAFTDGRDTPPKSGATYLEKLQSHIDERGTGHVATVSGRYYAMDRDENWERTKRAFDAIVTRESIYAESDPVTAVEASYERDTTDEFVEPTCIEEQPALTDGDGAIFFNFRSDRARQLTRMLAGIEPEGAIGTSGPDIRLITMTEYDKTFELPVAFPPNQPEKTVGAVLAEEGLTQLRIAETEKYAHVTYFFNGGREIEFDGELRTIVPSPDVPTYDEKPEMSAPEVTDEAVETIETSDPDVVVLNYANPDMVGHTGDFEAAICAVEAVDSQLGRLVEAIHAAGGAVIITADHGNADDMGTVAEPHTAHTTNPVPWIYLTAGGDSGGRQVRTGGTLADIAPTILELLEISQPAEMTGTSLLK